MLLSQRKQLLSPSKVFLPTHIFQGFMASLVCEGFRMAGEFEKENISRATVVSCVVNNGKVGLSIKNEGTERYLQTF